MHKKFYLLLLAGAVFLGGLGYIAGKFPEPFTIDGNRASYGCLISAGYSWSVAEQKCIQGSNFLDGESSVSAGKFCGGIAGIACAPGYTCKLAGTYPDAGGICTENLPKGKVCAQVITPARNPQTGEIKDFPTSCSVPAGWEPVK